MGSGGLRGGGLKFQKSVTAVRALCSRQFSPLPLVASGLWEYLLLDRLGPREGVAGEPYKLSEVPCRGTVLFGDILGVQLSGKRGPGTGCDSFFCF